MERVLDQQGRWRNKIISFRMSPEEDEVLKARVKLSGLTKQDYIINRLLGHEIKVVGNPRIYKALKMEMEAVYEQLVRIENGESVNKDLLEVIQAICSYKKGRRRNTKIGKTKMTVPNTSVGADEEQPSTKSSKASITYLSDKSNLRTINLQEYGKQDMMALQTISMAELYDTTYPPKLPIVDGLIYEGTYLFVGAPKVGKSFFMAQLGYHVSMGLDLWGYSVRKGTVLYLALEDDYARLQKRLSRMFGMESSENFYFATKSKTLNEGLEEQLNQFIKQHTDARLLLLIRYRM